MSHLAPVWVGEGFPADVRQASHMLESLDLDPRETPVLVARSMSPGARAVLADAGLSWADERGEALIVAEPGLYVSRGIAAPVQPSSEATEMSWAPGSAAVGEAVLGMATSEGWSVGAVTPLPSVTGLAERLGVSAPLVTRTLQAFDGLGWTEKVGPERGSGAGRVLTDATGLLSSWAAHRSGRGLAQAVGAHALIGNPEEFVREVLTEAWSGELWAVTGWVALERRAPFVTTVPTVDLYLDEAVLDDARALSSALDRAGLRQVTSGPRVLIRPADRYLSALLSASSTPHQVSDVRLYSDLLTAGVRGPEAAEHLRETRIGF